VGVLRNGQDHAIIFLLRPSVAIGIVMVMAVMGGAGVIVGCGVSALMFGGAGQSLEEMMHPMGSGGDQEETKRGGGAQMEAALKLRDWSSGFHRVLKSILGGTAGKPQAVDSCAATLLDGKFDLVAGVQFGNVIGCYDAQLEDMFAGLDAVERAFVAVEHSHQFAVDISMGMVPAFALGEFILDRYLVTLENLIFGRRENLDACAFGRFKRGFTRLCSRRFRRWLMPF
jgi:hypothetical protein